MLANHMEIVYNYRIKSHKVSKIKTLFGTKPGDISGLRVFL